MNLNFLQFSYFPIHFFPMVCFPATNSLNWTFIFYVDRTSWSFLLSNLYFIPCAFRLTFVFMPLIVFFAFIFPLPACFWWFNFIHLITPMFAAHFLFAGNCVGLVFYGTLFFFSGNIRITSFVVLCAIWSTAKYQTKLETELNRLQQDAPFVWARLRKNVFNCTSTFTYNEWQ